jgi:ectoine hydroxylase-related dioxygenase (phytanoyl-CoA dioxygenase family)
VGVSVTGADAGTGQLKVVAGSHRALVQPAFVRPDLDLPIVELPTRTGDVTVHLSCTLHMSQAPTTAERRVLYTGFRLPDEGRTSKATADKLSRIRESSYKNVNQPRGEPHGRGDRR